MDSTTITHYIGNYFPDRGRKLCELCKLTTAVNSQHIGNYFPDRGQTKLKETSYEKSIDKSAKN